VNENFSPPYLRRRVFRKYGGELVEVWALTEAGVLLAEDVLGTALKTLRSDVGAEFLEHEITLNDLFVALADPTTRACPACGRPGLSWRKASRDRYLPSCACGHVIELAVARAEELPFRWLASESSRLPWTEYDRKTGRSFDRFIRPDAILELGLRRLFLECEMGTHSVNGGETKPGSTLAKADRYDKFIHGMADATAGMTFYARAFADGLPPELLFLVPTEARKRLIGEALATWTRRNRRLAVSVMMVSEAVSALLPDGAPVGLKTSSSPGSRLVDISGDDVQTLQRFFNGVVGPIKRARLAARATHAELPSYPPGSDAVVRLIQRLAETIDPRSKR
jgi:hypothetical protein